MSNFIVTCKFDKMQENGSVKRVSEKYLCDALSVVEADAVVTENLKPYISGDFFTSKVENSPIAEVFNADADRFWLAKVAFITIDEKTAKEKHTVSQILVGAPDFTNAVEGFNEGMKQTMADWKIISVAETPYMGVYPAKLNQ